MTTEASTDRPRRRVWRVMLITLVGAAIIAVALVLDYFCLPSYVGKVTLRNDSSSTVAVHYAGTIFERGTIGLAPGAETSIVVLRGELGRHGYAVQLKVRPEGAAEDRVATFTGLHPRNGRPVIVISDEAVRLIHTPSTTTSPAEQQENG